MLGQVLGLQRALKVSSREFCERFGRLSCNSFGVDDISSRAGGFPYLVVGRLLEMRKIEADWSSN